MNRRIRMRKRRRMRMRRMSVYFESSPSSHFITSISVKTVRSFYCIYYHFALFYDFMGLKKVRIFCFMF